MTGFARVADAVIEAPVVTSFTSIGFEARKRLEGWGDPVVGDMHGRTVLITGASSGLGYTAAEQLAAAGADVILLGRNRDKTEACRDELAARTGNEGLDVATADMGDLDAVRTVCAGLLERLDRLDVLVHNAGALSADRTAAPGGLELTVASQVVGPHLMTTLLLPLLRTAEPGRVLTMSSGGMYSAPLRVTGLQMDEGSYKGAQQYALAKRAQVTLNEMWAERVPADEVVFHALHPGWADTPGVEEALPTFRRIVGPVLRTPAQGVDTLVWLATAAEAEASSGGFWLDRRLRSIHKLPATRRSDTTERRGKLWDWVEGQLA